ncbi:aldo/keto reductase, partial [Flavobacteriaceae bacterium]|nr:aldo/keto reductase [Flavobacteriaceae bacterium]
SETIAKTGRETQKQFLDYCLQFFRQALLLNYKSPELVFLETQTPKFNLQNFAPFVHSENILAIGLSNETPWGTMKYLQTANAHNLVRPITIQNSYSMIHRAYEAGMSEVSMREDIGLLAYSPLAQGVLSGKYLDGKSPEGSRGNLFPRFIARYMGDGSLEAVKRYEAIAKKNGITLTELSLAFVNQLPFVTSNIIGATKMSQLKENIGSIYIELSEETLQEIAEVHAMIPNPAP